MANKEITTKESSRSFLRDMKISARIMAYSSLAIAGLVSETISTNILEDLKNFISDDDPDYDRNAKDRIDNRNMAKKLKKINKKRTKRGLTQLNSLDELSNIIPFKKSQI